MYHPTAPKSGALPVIWNVNGILMYPGAENWYHACLGRGSIAESLCCVLEIVDVLVLLLWCSSVRNDKRLDLDPTDRSYWVNDEMADEGHIWKLGL